MKRALLMLVTLLVVASAPPAKAATFAVTPKTAKFEANARVAVFTIANKDPDAAVIQVSAYRWDQETGKDRLVKTSDLVALPAVFYLQGQGMQTIRVGLTGNADPTRELSYRLIFHQVANKTFSGRRSLVMVMSLSLPLYIEPNAPTSAELTWSTRRIDAKHVRLTVANSGTRHAFLKNVRAVGENGQRLAMKAPPIVVLPGGEVSTIVSSATSITGIVVQSNVDGAASKQTLAVARP
jgi:fimbrial chaperone protein